ncbi:MAG TPA: tripartite tricarboxylate transporter substrate-binding protein, partial [Burkholderiales bacterium]|nr:tripartite tricarboxylate transporter substrate-binding protein [Burkholderiales bacterium]
MTRQIIAVVLAALSGIAAAQNFPTRPITLVVPFPPGGSTDTTARIIAERMRQPLGQTVVIENAGGASGSIALGRLARAAPDGYTIDIGQWDTHVGNIIYPLTYDLQKDFEPIGLMTINPQLMIARKDFPANDLKALVAWMKSNPGKATLVEQTAAAKIAGIQMEQATGTTLTFVPFRGAGPGMQAMLGGQVDLMILQAAAVMPQARAGAIKIIANLSPKRSAVIPDVPTSDESGVPGLYAAGWFGLFGPKGMKKEVVAKLNAAMVEALADPALKARFSDLGLDLAPRELQTPEGLAAFHKAETDKWWPVIRA